MKYVICHYSEIALKSGNRKFFEEQLIRNIKRVLRRSLFYSVKRISGRIIIELTDDGEKNEKEIEKSLAFVFGISNFSFSISANQEIEDIQEKSLDLLKEKKFKKFKIETKRSKKDFFLSSREINEKVGEHILNNLKNISVNLNNPEVVCFIEVVENYVFIFTEKKRGQGGLPSGSSGKAVSLLSGGIDSPVASFWTMRRGVNLVFVHFHSYPATSQDSIDKVKEITSILSCYQGKSKLYLIPISEIQKEIVLNVSEKLRIIFYRRIMYKIAAKIAEKEKAQILVSGDSIGQVASQTVENIRAIESGLDIPVIRPLACQDKESIIKEAQKIGTFELSIMPHDDCCSRFLPKRPETRAKIEEVIDQEKNINVDKMIKKGIDEAIVIIK